MPDNEPTFSLPELARLGEVTPRTIRYYIGQGLLPSPVAEGPNTRYTSAHLDRLQLVRELQREHLPLAEIRSRMERLGDEQVRDLLAVGDAIPEPRGTAFDYIQSVLSGTNRRAFALPMPKPQWRELEAPSFLRTQLKSAQVRPVRMTRPKAAPASAGIEASATPAAPASQPAPSSPGPESRALDRSQWDRVSLAPDVELHIRRPLSRIQNRRVERLLEIARHILEEDQP